jgi:hypothetical protein
MVALGSLHPQDVIEQEGVAVAGRQALVGESGRADHHLAQLPNFRMDAKLNALQLCHDNLLCKVRR